MEEHNKRFFPEYSILFHSEKHQKNKKSIQYLLFIYQLRDRWKKNPNTLVFQKAESVTRTEGKGL